MITLAEPDLGLLQLLDDPFTVVSFQIGWPVARSVMRNRALANGVIDDTRFSGARAVTVGLRLNDKACGGVSMQDLFDQVMPFMVARRRPVLSWSLPGSDATVRQLTVRGADAPVVVAGPKHPVLALSFVAAEGEITSVAQQCANITPSAATAEPGRTYPLTFPRTYPASPGIGARLVTVGGNEVAHWVATLHGAITNPLLSVNGITINFDERGGVVLASGSTLVIDTRARTIYLNGDPSTPRYDKTNLTEWSWSDLLFDPGVNTLRFDGTSIGADASVDVCWYDTWVS